MTVLRMLVERSLEVMEGGKFQDFCLEFLPLYDPRFVSLTRVGHTAAGKTRAGTPDLLKTDESGQRAVQCGTDEDYWPSEQAIEHSKPYTDGMKCISAVEQLVEIVLIANRETPPRTPNIKWNIAAALRRSTNAEVTLLELGDLGQYLFTHLDSQPIRRLVGRFCPEAAGAIEAREDADRLRILNAIAAERSVDLRAVLPVVSDALATVPDVQMATGYVLERLDELNRCRLHELPTFAGIVRTSVARLPLTRPHGKIWVLIGVPKAGKTQLVLQLVRTWGEATVRWFECPLSESQACIEEIVAELIHLVLPEAAAALLMRSPSKLDAALAAAKPSEALTVIVVDNADRLSATDLDRLAEVLRLFRARGHLSTLACVFITSRPLGSVTAVADHVVTPPAWTAEELRLLLDHRGIAWEREAGLNYLELLGVRSGGHPLLALVLAQRYGQLRDLFLSIVEGVPSLADEDLSRQVERLLYEDLLSDADAQNFVQRLSVLVGRTPVDVLEALRIEVAPSIAVSTNVLLARLSPAVIEGSAQNGFEVAFVFREVAKRMISPIEKTAVYRAVANRLLTPRGRTIVADRVCTGVVYAVFSGESERGIFWTMILLKHVLDKGLSNEIVAGLLDRLTVMSVIRPPDSPFGRWSHALMLLMFSYAYDRIGQYEKAADVLNQVKLEEPVGGEYQKIRDDLPLVRLLVALGRAANLLMARRAGARSALESIGSAELVTVKGSARLFVLELLAEVVRREGLSARTAQTINAAIVQATDRDERIQTAALRLAEAVGYALSEAGAEAPDVSECFPGDAIGMVLQDTARGILCVERGEGLEGGRHLAAAADAARQQGWASGAFWSDLRGHAGDAAWRAGDQPAAVAAYRDAYAAGSAPSFMWAWSAWRLGLLSDDAAALADAATAFKTLGMTSMWARAVGARGVLLLQSGEELGGLRFFAEIQDAYYQGRDAGAGPAATIAQAQLVRYGAQREGRPIPDDDQMFPALSPAPYDSVIETAKPRAGAVVAYYALGEGFKRAGSGQEARRFLIAACDATPENDTDVAVQPLALSTLIGALSSSEADRDEIAKRIHQFLTIPRPQDRDPLFAYRMFAEEDARPTRDDGWQRLEALAAGLEQGVCSAGVNSAFWEAETLCARARLAERSSGERDRAARLWAAAMGKAIASQNGRVMYKAGWAIGFDFFGYTRSIRELARYQFEGLRGAEVLGFSFEPLGKNLFIQWIQIDYTRLSERDLEAKRMLRESAKEMHHAGTREDIAAAAMVLLLARLHRHEGPSVEWAQQRLSGHQLTIPEDVRRRLEGDPTA